MKYWEPRRGTRIGPKQKGCTMADNHSHHDHARGTSAEHPYRGGDESTYAEKGHDHEGHDKHAGHSVSMFRDKFWLSLVLTVPVVFWSEHIQMLLDYSAPSFPGSQWIEPVLGTI